MSPSYLRESPLYVWTVQPLSTVCDLFQEPHPHPSCSPDSVAIHAVLVTQKLHAKCTGALIPATQEAETSVQGLPGLCT